MKPNLEERASSKDEKHLIAAYGMCDYSGEYWGLIMYRMENGKVADTMAPIGEAQNIPLHNQKIVEYCKENNITRVYAPNSLSVVNTEEEMFYFSDEPDEDGFRPWGELKPCYEWTDYHDFLEAEGIEVKFMN